jgi:hypothetical protein
MATLTPQTPTLTGITPSYAAAAGGGDQVQCSDRLFLHVKNTNAATRTVTVATPNNVEGLAISDVSVVVGATTGDVMIGPLKASLFADANGFAQITYSATTNLTVAAIQV